MDIVKRAYLKTLDDFKPSFGMMPPGTVLTEFHQAVRAEIIRLIKVRAYAGRDWPRELGPLPDELKSKKGVCYESAKGKAN